MPNIPIDGVTVIAVILIAAFGIDQVVRALIFGLSFVKPWRRYFPDPDTQADPVAAGEARKKAKFAYYALAALLGIAVIAVAGNVRIFYAVGFEQVNPILDSLFTGLVLVAGADRVGDLIGLMPEGGVKTGRQAPPPVEITGRLILEDDTTARTLSRGSDT